MSDSKRPSTARATKPSRLNSTVTSGRSAATDTRPTAKDTKTRPNFSTSSMRPPPLNRTVASEQSFAVPAAASAPERDCELKLEYNKLLESIFMECMLDDSIQKERTEIDLQMTELAKRCEMNVDLLDKTNKRLKEITFLAEQQRILDMKDEDCSKFYNQTDISKAEKILQDLTQKQQSYLDRVETRNVDLGYNEQSGHRQLLDALDDAIQGYENIKKQSKLDPEMFKEFGSTNKGLEKVQRELMDLEDLKKEFEAKFPELSERALIQSSAELSRMMEKDLGLGESDEE